MTFKPFHNPAHLYFVTGTIIHWLNILEQECYAEIILNSLEWHRINNRMKLFAYVIMPDHLHWICLPLLPFTINGIIQSFGSFTAHKILHEARKKGHMAFISIFAEHSELNKSHKIWENFQAKNIISESFLHQKFEYIHNNPVEKGWCSYDSRSDYNFSSACYYDKGTCPTIAIDDLNEYLVNPD